MAFNTLQNYCTHDHKIDISSNKVTGTCRESIWHDHVRPVQKCMEELFTELTHTHHQAHFTDLSAGLS